jgi:hypothetical protein
LRRDLIVKDLDAVYARAKAARATVVEDIQVKMAAAASRASIRKAISGTSGHTIPGL